MSTVYVDLETGPAELLHSYGPGFIRLIGYAEDDGPVCLTTDVRELCRVLDSADLIVGHNVIGYDLAALEHWHGLDVARLVVEGRVRDTLLMARQAFPPESGHKKPQAADALGYSLDDLAARFGLAGKLTCGGESVLHRLAKKHGDFDEIPIDDADYRAYLERDVELLREVALRLPIDEYVLREHAVMWRLGQITRHGFRVDVEEATRRHDAQQQRLKALRQDAAQQYALPTSGAKPHTTSVGRAAIERAFADAGVTPPRTAKGAIATGKGPLTQLMEQHADNAKLVTLCELLLALNGERSTVDMLLQHTHPDGRVHPAVSASQATGRVSVTKPGLTTMGKRDRANVLERSLLLPDDGEVLLAADLSQIDARAMAAHSQDTAYLAAFEPGEDLHAVMAQTLFGDRGRRKDAKAFTHATTYGMGARALSERTGLDLDEARALLARLDAQYPQLAAFKHRVRAGAETGHVVTTAFGRRIGITPDREYTQAPAAIGQGTARDLMMAGVLRLPGWLVPRIRAIVHDEVILSIPAERWDEARDQVLAALQFNFQLTPDAMSVAVLAQVSAPGRDWADCYRDELADWPEVSRTHREQASCDDTGCTWHRPPAGPNE